MPIHPHPKPERGPIQVLKPKNPTKKANPASLFNVEQDSKEGREEKRGKAQGKKKGKNRCAMHHFFFIDY
jgi:hypothetical protein